MQAFLHIFGDFFSFFLFFYDFPTFHAQVKNEASRKMKEAITMYHITNEQTDLDDAIEAVQQRVSGFSQLFCFSQKEKENATDSHSNKKRICYDLGSHMVSPAALNTEAVFTLDWFLKQHYI